MDPRGSWEHGLKTIDNNLPLIAGAGDSPAVKGALFPDSVCTT